MTTFSFLYNLKYNKRLNNINDEYPVFSPQSAFTTLTDLTP